MRATKPILGLAAAILLATAAPAGASLLPVGDWTFNEGRGSVARDYSGHHEEGQLEGAAQWTRGRFQDGLSFDGSTAAVRVADNPALEPAQVTVSAWVKAAASPGIYRYVLAKGANGCAAASYGLYTGPDGGIAFYTSREDGFAWTISPEATASTVWNGQWHNVIGTYDGSIVRLYLDGREIGSGTPDSAPIAYNLQTSDELSIGAYPWCPSSDFAGEIDEVKVFDRALGAQEIGLGYGISRLLPSVIPFDVIL
ncbi:MAG TPA: LamG domain-containing protein [Solirubrobacteraceae bacterium]|nr:LamG domain-containing protein [Solirubrobacteraceae bacterium]